MNPDDIDTPAPVALSPDKKDDGLSLTTGKNKGVKGKKPVKDASQNDDQPEDISFEGLMANLPLNAEKLAASNTLLAENLFELGKLFQQELQDYGEAINTYDESLKRFPDSTYDGEIYVNLAYCYGKLGMNDKAEQYKKLVKQKFAGGKADKMLDDLNAAKTGIKNPEATKRYEGIYNLFIEGRFDEALAEKKKADSLYDKSFWTPQLLYIEAVYHVKQKDDSTAIIVLSNIITLYPKSPLKPKAERIL